MAAVLFPYEISSEWRLPCFSMIFVPALRLLSSTITWNLNGNSSVPLMSWSRCSVPHMYVMGAEWRLLCSPMSLSVRILSPQRPGGGQEIRLAGAPAAQARRQAGRQHYTIT